MQCDRLIKQIKTWFLHVQNETMAPARMISFIENHASTCEICQADPDLQTEISRIIEIILPEAKIPKAVRLQQEESADDEAEDEEEGTADTEEGETEDKEEEEEDVFDLDDDEI